MEKNRAPPPHQKIENQNVSKTGEQLEKNNDVSIQNDKRFEGLKSKAIHKSEENMAPLPTLPPQHQEIQTQNTTKGQLISKGYFGFSNSPKKLTKTQ